MKWLNLLLTLIAVTAIYYFLHDNIPAGFQIPFIVALAAIAIYSLFIVFRKEKDSGNNEDH